MSMTDWSPSSIQAPAIQAVEISNYRGLHHAKVKLAAITVLVGTNNSGKSTFLDALAFIGESIRFSPETAVSQRPWMIRYFREWLNHIENVKSGVDELSEKSSLIVFRFQLLIDVEPRAYGLQFAPHHNADVRQPFRIDQELLQSTAFEFVREQNQISVGTPVFGQRLGLGPNPQKISTIQLGLNAFDLPEFAGMEKTKLALANTIIINPSPRDWLNEPERSQILDQASTLSNAFFERLCSYLKLVIPNLKEVRLVYQGRSDIEFELVDTDANKKVRPLRLEDLSDGTLRLFRILLALLTPRTGLVCIEEPEAYSHPAMIELILEAARDAIILHQGRMQVLITTHSPDLLDRLKLEDGREKVIVASHADGQNTIGELDQVSLEALRRNLYSLGELLSLNQIGLQQT